MAQAHLNFCKIKSIREKPGVERFKSLSRVAHVFFFYPVYIIYAGSRIRASIKTLRKFLLTR